MSPKVIGPAAALAGVPTGIQAQGVWAGRRQLFIRFAAEAETATMYTAQALAKELERLCARSVVHSVSVAGRDPLASADFLAAAFDAWKATRPVMADLDGQRPDALERVVKRLALVQVTTDLSGGDAWVERALQTLRVAAGAGVPHALVLLPSPQASDGQILRVVEQAHAASDGTMMVVHPPTAESSSADRRWAALLEQASVVHEDVRITLRLPPGLGMR